MRKIYIKPMMNSEEFVTNEYIAACWKVTCICSNKEKKHGAFIYRGDEPKDDGYPYFGNDDFDYFSIASPQGWYYKGNMFNAPGDYDTHGYTNLHLVKYDNTSNLSKEDRFVNGVQYGPNHS